MRTQRGKIRWAAVVLVGAGTAWAGLGLAGCGGSGEAPVGRLRVEPRRLALPFPGYREIRIELTPSAPIGEGVGSDTEPVLFVHLLGEPGEVLRTFDQPLPKSWRPGQRLRFPVRLFQSAMARPLPAGRYRLTAGLYVPGGRRWPLEFDGAQVDRGEYLVAEVEVPEGPGSVPRFEFLEAWSEPEAGSDRQVLARRWLGGEGRIEVTDLKPPGRLWLALRIPRPPVGGARVLGERAPGEGEAVPSVVVQSTCGELQVAVSGVGLHEVEIPVVADEEVTGCTLRLEPNFYDQLEGGFDRRSAALEAVAWIGR